MQRINLFIVGIFALILGACAKENNFNPHLNDQNAKTYLDPHTANQLLISAEQQHKLYTDFINHYYSPWTGTETLLSNDDIKKNTLEDIDSFSKDPGWNENFHQHSQQWMKGIIENTVINEFPNDLHNAIVTHSTDERTLPTNKPSYSSVSTPGEFFPFDNLQSSYLPVGLPIKIIQQSKDHAWDLVLTNGSYGWVNAADLALTNAEFEKQWQDNQGYIEFNKDDQAIIDDNNVYWSSGRMGSLFPVAAEDQTSFKIKIAIKDPNGNAIIKFATVNKNDVTKIPLVATPQNVATVANQFIGVPYGWGSLYGYRDCSATTKGIYSYFGIWLPRNSTQQAKLGGKSIDLTGLSDKEKQKVLSQHAIPFFTLVHLPGHIMIYLGEKNNVMYVLQNMWGLHTYRLKESGRAIIGKTVITPIDFGKQYLNVQYTALSKSVGITILGHSEVQVAKK